MNQCDTGFKYPPLPLIPTVTNDRTCNPHRNFRNTHTQRHAQHRHSMHKTTMKDSIRVCGMGFVCHFSGH